MDAIEKLQKNGISVNSQDISKICLKYGIREFSIFGSSLRDDFRENSDIDVLVSFKDDAEISLFDLVDLENELTSLLRRKVDLVEKEALKNPIRKKNILNAREVIYAS